MISNIHELLHPKGFFAALWPYSFSAMAFGRCNAASKKLRAIYAIVTVPASLLSCYFITYDLYAILVDRRESDVQFVIGFVGFWCYMIFVPIHISTWFFVGNSCYTDVVTSLTLLDRELAQICCKHVNLEEAVIRQLLSTFLSVLLSITFLVVSLWPEPKVTGWWYVFQISFCQYSITFTIVSISFFGNLVCFTGDRYALINYALKRIGSGMQTYSVTGNLSSVILDEVTLTRQLRVVHRKLFFVSRKIMEAFGIQVFIYILASFCYTVYNSYLRYSDISSPSSKWTIPRILVTVTETFYDFGLIFYVSYCCHQTVQEANGTTKILNSLTTGSEDLRLEVSSFSHQLMHYQLHFSPLGFFKLDLALVQSMVGSMATYLVILVQMGPVPTEHLKNTTALHTL